MRAQNNAQIARMPTDQDIGGRVRQRREAIGISQAELASRAGTTQKHVSDIERGKRLMGAYMLLRLSKALHASADALLGLDGHDPRADEWAAGYAAGWREAERRVLSALQVDPRIRR